MKILLVVLALMSSPAALAIGYVIGNGGDAVFLKDGRLVLRDLFEAGIENSVYFGKSENLALAQRVRGLTKIDELEYSKDLLTRKLSDLETLSPNLGHYVFEAIQAYTWKAVREPLLSVPDPEQILNLPRGGAVQIANRTDTVIRVDAIRWPSLSPENRVALLIHEAIYSLLKPICNTSCYQPARTARTLTALAFTETSYADPHGTAAKILPFLAVPLAKEIESTKQSWTIRWTPPQGASLDSFSLSSQIPLKDGHFQSMIHLSCEKFRGEIFARRALAQEGGFLISSSLTIPGYSLRFETYPTTYMGHESHQLRLVIAPGITQGQRRLHFELEVTNAQSCEEILDQHYRSVTGGG